jgi:tRNA threonylcarbamoyladenosine dehydratase
MKNDWQSKTRLMIGNEPHAKLQQAKVLVAGLGGVGAVAAEMLCRAGVGSITIVDADKVNASNRNRQILALHSTEAMEKIQVMAKRLLDINPELKLHTSNAYLKDEAIVELLAQPFDYVVDAIDTLSPKVYFIYYAMKNNYKLVSSMGAGGRMDPAQVLIGDISETYQCKLAFDLRKRLRRLGMSSGFKAVFSSEPVPPASIVKTDKERNKKSNVGTISYMPAIFGCYCASVVIRDLIRT